jgi:hypothetical protein
MPRIESGQGGQPDTLLRIAKALNFVEAFMDACQQPHENLDDLQRRDDLLVGAEPAAAAAR